MSRPDFSTPSFSSLEIAWLSGILEGEGCFGCWAHRRPGGNVAFRITISLVMTDEDVVARVASIFGKNVSANKLQPRRKQSFTTRITGHRAAHLMELLRPFMGARRQQQIKQALRTWSQVPHLRERGKLADCHPDRPNKGGGLCASCHRQARHLSADPRRRVGPLTRDWLFVKGPLADAVLPITP